MRRRRVGEFVCEGLVALVGHVACTPVWMVLMAGFCLGSWPWALLAGASALCVFGAPRGSWRYTGLLVLGCLWVVGGILLALMRWEAGDHIGVVGAGLLLCAGVLALAETASRSSVVGAAEPPMGVAVRRGADAMPGGPSRAGASEITSSSASLSSATGGGGAE